MYINTKLTKHSRSKLSKSDWETLEGLESVLVVRRPLDLGPRTDTHHKQVPHEFLQATSAETTPTLSRAIINFEEFMSSWERLGQDHVLIKFWTTIGLRWATKYYIRMDNTEAYVLAMCKLTNWLIPALTASLPYSPQSHNMLHPDRSRMG